MILLINRFYVLYNKKRFQNFFRKRFLCCMFLVYSVIVVYVYIICNQDCLFQV